MRLEERTVWLNQRQLGELYGKAKGTVSEHIRNIFADRELEPGATVRKFRTVQSEGGREVAREVEHYNLDMVLALGFRVRSHTAVRFRQWAADKLKEYIVKGFVLDDARLKNPQVGNDYFDELTKRIQEIRTSERRFYQKITDIYATSVDYDKNHPLTQEFFATVQNKVHFAIHGQTANGDRKVSGIGYWVSAGAWPLSATTRRAWRGSGRDPRAPKGRHEIARAKRSDALGQAPPTRVPSPERAESHARATSQAEPRAPRAIHRPASASSRFRGRVVLIATEIGRVLGIGLGSPVPRANS